MKSKKFSFVLIGRIISAGLQGVFYLVFATLLEPNVYGNLSYIISLAGTFAIISRFGLNHTVIVYQAKNNSVLVNQVNVLSIISITLASIILLTINVFAALLCLAASFFMMNIHNQIGLKKYKKYFWLEISRGTLIIILPILLYFYYEIPGILIGMSIGYFVCSFNFLKNIKFSFGSSKLLRAKFRVLLHNFGVDVSSRLGRVVDKLLIAPLLGFTFLGIYQLNVQILFAFEMLPIALHSFLLSEESSGIKHKKIGIMVIGLSIIVVIAVILSSPFLINTFLPKYSEGIPSLQILIISLVPLSISAIFSAKLQAKESSKVGFSALVRIGSLLGLIAILGSTFDLIGLSLSVLISTILHTIFLLFLYTTEKGKGFSGHNLKNG